jgi:spermidine/putrescine transport system ATP-binding protein
VRVREAVYRGAYQEAWLEPCDIRVRTAPHPTLQAGQELWAELPVDALVVLDE